MAISTEIVICGAGIAGISAAYHLAVQRDYREIILVDERPPLSLTSDKSTECYRNWWPGPGDAMVALMNRSIDLLEQLALQTGNLFNLSRRGYLYLSAESDRLPELQAQAQAISRLGAGPLRIHRRGSQAPAYQPATPEGFTNEPSGADLILDRDLLRHHFPYITSQAAAALHVRRAGWFSAQQLGAYLLAQARARGVQLSRAAVRGVEVRQGSVTAVQLDNGQRIRTRRFINAGGPMLGQVAQMLGVELPVYNELHLKVAFKDFRSVIPRNAPLLIWTDKQTLPWSEEERRLLAEDPQTGWLLEEMPPGVHTRPEGGPDSPIVLMLWEYREKKMQPVWPVPLDPVYPEVALRGLASMIPGLQVYFENAQRPILDGGYYTKTPENRPLIGPLPVDGAYVIGALSGYGLMASMAAGELLAAHVANDALPDYAPAFSLQRYQDRGYLRRMREQSASGQL
jgi:glycine/D-amino acid oxidase-like deaminating enzyme